MEWIPIDKDWPEKGELPNAHDDVFVSIGENVFEAFRSMEGDCWCVYGIEMDFTKELNVADAWMPKPKPYRG